MWFCSREAVTQAVIKWKQFWLISNFKPFSLFFQYLFSHSLFLLYLIISLFLWVYCTSIVGFIRLHQRLEHLCKAKPPYKLSKVHIVCRRCIILIGFKKVNGVHTLLGAWGRLQVQSSVRFTCQFVSWCGPPGASYIIHRLAAPWKLMSITFRNK